MDSTETLPTSGNARSDQVGGETEPLGGNSQDGADSRDQGAGGADETSAKNQPAPDNSTSVEDDDAAFLKALADGNLDSVDSNGKPAKPADKPEETHEEPVSETNTDPVAKKDESAEKTDETLKETEPDKPKPDASLLSDEEKADIAKAPKGYRRKLEDLLTERATQRATIETVKAEAESLKPVKAFADKLIQHATDAGLVESKDGKIDTSRLRDLIEQERQLSSKSPKEIAAYYRGLADDVYPDGRAVEIPADLKDLVEIGSLKTEEAEALARKREAAAKPPDDRRLREAETARQAEQAHVAQLAALKQAQAKGFEQMNAVGDAYEKRFGPEWKEIAKVVKAELEPLLGDTKPESWGKLAKTVIEGVVARRRNVPVKKPTTTPPPSNTSAPKAGELMSEEEENRRLAAGTL